MEEDGWSGRLPVRVPRPDISLRHLLRLHHPDVTSEGGSGDGRGDEQPRRTGQRTRKDHDDSQRSQNIRHRRSVRDPLQCRQPVPVPRVQLGLRSELFGNSLQRVGDRVVLKLLRQSVRVRLQVYHVPAGHEEVVL